MTGPLRTDPPPSPPSRSASLWDYLTNLGDVQWPLGSSQPLGLGGLTLNDLLVGLTDTRADTDRLLPETLSLNDIGRALQFLSPENLTQEHLNAIATPADPNEPRGEMRRLLNLFPAAGAEGGGVAAPAVERGAVAAAKAGGTNSLLGALFDLSPEARAARAAEQGYTVEAFHGTRRDFDQFKPTGHDMGIHVGTDEAANDILAPRSAVQYWTEKLDHPDEQVRQSARRTLDEYTQNANILPLKVRAGTALDMPDIGRWRDPNNFLHNATEEKRVEGRWTRVPKGWEPPQPLFDELVSLAKSARNADHERTMWENGFKDILRRHGYDSVRYINTSEAPGSTSYMLLDPSQARSRFAAFDPAKVGDPNLLSAHAGGSDALIGGLLGAAPEGQPIPPSDWDNADPYLAAAIAAHLGAARPP